ALIPRVPFGQQPAHRAARMNRARYVLISDIGEFYPSIYTHSLEWALHGKAASKARLAAKRRAPFGRSLDQAVAIGQGGQTKGIPIGPDTSLLLAEIILTAVDLELQQTHPDVHRW